MIQKEPKGNLSFNLVVALIIGILFSIIYWSGGMRRYENILSDLIVTTFTDPKQASSQIVYAMTSQQCLNEAEIYYNMGWPWKRATYSKLIEFLNLAGAKIIVFNSVFSEKSVYRYYDSNDVMILKLIFDTKITHIIFFLTFARNIINIIEIFFI